MVFRIWVFIIFIRCCFSCNSIQTSRTFYTILLMSFMQLKELSVKKKKLMIIMQNHSGFCLGGIQPPLPHSIAKVLPSPPLKNQFAIRHSTTPLYIAPHCLSNSLLPPSTNFLNEGLPIRNMNLTNIDFVPTYFEVTISTSGSSFGFSVGSHSCAMYVSF